MLRRPFLDPVAMQLLSKRERERHESRWSIDVAWLRPLSLRPSTNKNADNASGNVPLVPVEREQIGAPFDALADADSCFKNQLAAKALDLAS